MRFINPRTQTGQKKTSMMINSSRVRVNMFVYISVCAALCYFCRAERKGVCVYLDNDVISASKQCTLIDGEGGAERARVLSD